MGCQGPSKPREGRADRDEGQGMGQGREKNGCPDILGKGGEGRSWRQDAKLGIND
jgi:hypothetical protein